ncbi:XrtA/PEP-CTERM system TPR-repeat protein PrsT [Catenovulum sediminis]|uniref:XrtA/PEP-CTERM system TPR-repeat protein PrsT n=1 Tax=Catenovulum sediminis TaxID=1740262 RepID=UPI00117D6213|nr:XrtA/PEP-CTERM system TPR-repeat protein PrsT [Catenovulum sediminis]
MRFLIILIPIFVLFSHATFAAEQRGYLYEEAIQAYQSNELDNAIIHLKNNLKEFPEFTPARILLGKVYALQENCLSAEKELTVALQERGDWQQVLPPLLNCQLQLHNTESAIYFIEQYPYQQVSELLIIRAKLALQQEQFGQAQQFASQALKLDKQDLNAQLIMAEVLVTQNQYQDAINILSTALQQRPNSVPALQLKARVLELRQNLEAALELYNRILELENNNTLALFAKASLLQKLDRGDEALKISVQLREQFPDNPFAKLLFAVISGANEIPQREVKETLNDINNQLSLVDLNKVPGGQLNLLSGYVHYLTQNYQSARREFLNYQNKHTSDATVYKLLAETSIKLSDDQQAFIYYREYNKRQPADEHALAKLLSLAKKLESTENYRSMLISAHEKFPQNASFRNHLAAIYLVSGEQNKARTLLEGTAQSNIYLLDIQLARLLISLHELEQAGKIASKLLIQQPQNPNSHQLAGDIYLAAQQPTKATVYYQQALKLQANYTPAVLKLASLAYKKQDYGQVEDLLKKLKTQSVEALELKAAVAIEQRKYHSAIDYLDTVYQTQPSLKTAKALIELYDRTGQFAAAQGLLSRYIEDYKLDAELLHFKIKLALQSDQAIALKDLNTLFALYYDDPKQLKALFTLEASTTRTDGQMKIIKRLQQLEEPSEQLAFLKVQLHIKNKEFELAQAQLEWLKNHAHDAIDAIDPISVQELEFNLLNSQNKHQQAKQLIKNLYEASRSVAHFKSYLGLLLQTQDTSAAITLLQSWLTKYPQDLPATYLLAKLHQQQNAPQQSILLLENSLQVSENAFTHHKLAHLYAEKNLNKALSHAQIAVQLDSQNPAFNDTYGWYLYQAQNYEKALEHFRVAMATAGQQSELIYHLAATLEKLNRPSEAITALEKLNFQDTNFKSRDKALKLYNKLKGK